ncbi:MAG: flagellar motor switch protein FliN [Terracidiphilus sp.]
MVNQSNHQAARAFAGAFAESLAEALTQASGLPWQLKVLEDPDLSARQGDAVQFQLTLEGALRGSFFVEFYEVHVKELASQMGGAPVDVLGDEHLETMEEFIAAATEGLAASLLAEYGVFTCKVERASGLAFGGMLPIPLAASQGEQTGISASLYFDGQLLSALAPSPVHDAAEAQKSSIDPLNLGLVMDVELSVSLRFGQRQLPLREVLELASGSVIELDRQVDDPVELLLDGKVIARGEAVIVDGNYGLRVTEIPQPMASHFVR